jgi:hypothetical protein
MVEGLVTIYEDPDFRGRGILFDVGNYRLFGSDDDVFSSIEVPAGFVAWVYEHADRGGGYGISADFLEDCSDLAQVGLNDKISYISVFRAERPPGLVWRRGAIGGDGQYVAGHWERKRVDGPPPNPTVAVSPPIAPHTGVIAVHAAGPFAEQAQSLYTVYLRGPNDPDLRQEPGRFDSSLTCTFSDLSIGKYWVMPDTKADVGWSVTPAQAEVDCLPPHQAKVVIRFGEGSGSGEGGGFGQGDRVRDHRGEGGGFGQGARVRDHRR